MKKLKKRTQKSEHTRNNRKKTEKKAPDSQTSQATCRTKEIDRAHRSHSTRDAKQNKTNKNNQGSPIKTIKSHDSILVPLRGRGVFTARFAPAMLYMMILHMFSTILLQQLYTDSIYRIAYRTALYFSFLTLDVEMKLFFAL